MFGNTNSVLANEDRVLSPRSPYGVTKAFAHHMTRVYRDSYGMHASTGILFNHESPLRDSRFVSKKIAQGVAQISFGMNQVINLGNLDSKRDWSFAGDVTEAMIKIIDFSIPDDYVIASGELHSVRDFVSCAFNVIGITEWSKYVNVEASLFRPNDIEAVSGDSSKARKTLNWNPKMNFNDLVSHLVLSEISALRAVDKQ
jgi:GDPmannose 4,6-dehydratase